MQNAIRRHVPPGMRLATPSRAAPFEVAEVNAEGLVLLLGKGQWRTAIPWEALEGVAALMRGRGWLPTTGSFAPADEALTLSGYLKQYVNRETANWVVAVLEAAEVLEVDRGRPVRARLAAGF